MLFNAKLAFFSAISTREQDAFQWDDVDVNFLHLDQFSANTPTQSSVGWNVVPFRHIILIYHSLHFLLKSKCVAGIEVAIHIGLEPMIYHTRAEHPNHYTTSTVCLILKDDTCTFKTPPRVLLLTSYLFAYMRIYIYKRMVLQCINGVGSNPVEGRTKIWQL